MENGPANRPARSVSARIRGKLILGILVAAALGVAGAVVFRRPLLSGMAKCWVVNDPAPRADAIVILGGGLEDRPTAAAKLFHDGVAPTILYMDVHLGETARMGITLPERELTRRLLLTNGVPESALCLIGSSVTSTYDESRAVRAWVEKTGAHSIVIPTDLFHTRRARWIFRRELRGVDVAVHVEAVTPPAYSIDDWWRHEDGLVAFQSEMIKSLYYHLKY